MDAPPRKFAGGIWLGFFAAFLIPAIYAIWAYVNEPIPPRNLTAARMFVVKRRIQIYAKDHNALPKTLTDLPPLPNAFDSLTADEWGREIDYKADPDGVVTLTSLGADKAEGGTGINKDMTAIFTARDSQGGWADPTTAWAKDPVK